MSFPTRLWNEPVSSWRFPDQKEVWIFSQRRLSTTRFCSALEGSPECSKNAQAIRELKDAGFSRKTLWQSSGFPGLRYMGIVILRKESPCILHLPVGVCHGSQDVSQIKPKFRTKTMSHIADCTSQWNYSDKGFANLPKPVTIRRFLLYRPNNSIATRNGEPQGALGSLARLVCKIEYRGRIGDQQQNFRCGLILDMATQIRNILINFRNYIAQGFKSTCNAVATDSLIITGSHDNPSRTPSLSIATFCSSRRAWL